MGRREEDCSLLDRIKRNISDILANLNILINGKAETSSQNMPLQNTSCNDVHILANDKPEAITNQYTDNSVELTDNIFITIIHNIKKSFSRYIAALFLQASSENDINIRIDKIINGKLEHMICGDTDLKEVILFAINCRRVERRLTLNIPILSGKVFIKAVAKSVIT